MADSYPRRKPNVRPSGPSYRANRNGYSGGAPPPSAANSGAVMGIKSGMTVEDLKRLTQKRIQESTMITVQEASTPKAVKSRPTISVPTASPMLPKTGMSVQELKQLTSLRLASQNNTPKNQNEAAKASSVGNNKTHVRDGFKSTHTPSGTPKRVVNNNIATRASSYNSENTMTNQVQKHDSAVSRAAAASAGSRAKYVKNYPTSPSSHGSEYTEHNTHTMDENYATSNSLYLDYVASPAVENIEKHTSRISFEDDSFPPPPPPVQNNDNAFVSTNLPSWSPPPARSKTYDSSKAHVSLYKTAFYDHHASSSAVNGSGIIDPDANIDQNTFLVPPPGLQRRPSMTVPWQVAESVLNTPQQISNRKSISLLSGGDMAGMGMTGAIGGNTGNTLSPTKLLRNISTSSNHNSTSSGGLKSPAKAIAAEFNLGSLHLMRQKSGGSSTNGILNNSTNNINTATMGVGGSGINNTSNLANASHTVVNNSTSATTTSTGRRGSFGNAAQLFKFRRRSKSRLEFARDLAGAMVDNASILENRMPGIDEVNHKNDQYHGHHEKIFETNIKNDDRSSSVNDDDDDAMANRSSNSSGPDSDQSDLENEDLHDYHSEDHSENGKETQGISFSNFFSSSHSTNFNAKINTNSAMMGDIPPPPPPLDELDSANAAFLLSNSPKSLPMMSPNGAKLRKVAQLARSGSLSSQDKTRVKDEIIQNSLGLTHSNLASMNLTKTPSTQRASFDLNDFPHEVLNDTSKPPVIPLTPGVNAPPGFKPMTNATATTLPTANVPTTNRGNLKSPLRGNLPEGIVRSTSIGRHRASIDGDGTHMAKSSNGGGHGSGGGNPNMKNMSLEERLAVAAQRVADCVSKSDMVQFTKAMEELDKLRAEANLLMLK